MIRRRAALGLALVTIGLVALPQVSPVLAASPWWLPVPGGPRHITLAASTKGQVTLVVEGGRLGWFRPATGRFTRVVIPAPTAPRRGTKSPGAPEAVAASGPVGVVAFADGALLQTRSGGESRWLSGVGGRPRALALQGGELVVASSKGIFSGRLGGGMRRTVLGSALAVVAPPRGRLEWLALVGGRLWVSPSGRRFLPAAGSPRFTATTSLLTELGSGTALVAEPQGLVWQGTGRTWQRVFQVLPYGGFGGVPRLTGLVSDGASSAYLGTNGFGTLLTPDGGYSWYRASPPDPHLLGLAVLGPVFARRPSGLVLGLTSETTYGHRLQGLPAPPVYAPRTALFELLGEAAVTVLAAALVLLALGLWGRRLRHRTL